MIVNGMKVEGSPKVVKVAVAGKELDLTLVHIADGEKIDATFDWIGAPEGIKITSRKAGNRVASTISKVTKEKDKEEYEMIFECLTAQSVFQILNVAFGMSIGKADSIYKNSNPTRKNNKGSKGATKVELKEAGVL